MMFLWPAISLALFILFLAWYDGWPRRPLSAKEYEPLLEKMKQQRAAQGAAGALALERFRAFAESDDGGEFHMVNLLRINREAGGSDAGRRYMRAWARAAVPRGSHPSYRGRVTGKIQGAQEDTIWDQVVLMRYRSRRDLWRIATDDGFMRDAAQKGVALSYTDAYPASPTLFPGSPRVLLFLALIILNLIVVAWG
jgi:hypothetical protein